MTRPGPKKNLAASVRDRLMQLSARARRTSTSFSSGTRHRPTSASPAGFERDKVANHRAKTRVTGQLARRMIRIAPHCSVLADQNRTPYQARYDVHLKRLSLKPGPTTPRNSPSRSRPDAAVHR